MFRTKMIMAAGFAAGLAVPALAADGGLPVQKILTAALANEAAMTAITTCAAQGYKVGAAIVDRHTDLVVLINGDGFRASNDTPRRKAYTAAMRGVVTSEYMKQMEGRPPPADPVLLVQAGGVPIKVGDDVIAAIGVGGAPGGDKDEACAQAGVEKIKDRLK